MSAECHQCGHDMGYGPMGVPVCAWCEIVNERNRYRDDLRELVDALDDANGYAPGTLDPGDTRVYEAIQSARAALNQKEAADG